ncbi:MAG TPA: response regulator [Anaeromyxobacteraceae bacterium]|nr:response regulator [Anaeromyxobacteraceae bacterium]
MRQKLLGKFREVTADRVEKISSGLLALEHGGDPDTLQELARELHTLKGEARMMGFTALSELVHAAEDLLKTLPPGGASAQLEAILEACDSIEALLDASPEAGDTARRLAERLRGLIAATSPAPVATSLDDQSAAGEEEGQRTSPVARHLAPRIALRPAGSIRVDIDRLDEIAVMAGDLLVEGARAKVRAQELSAILGRWNRLADRVVGIAEQVRSAGATKLAAQIEGDVHLLRSDTFRFVRSHSDAVSGMQSQFDSISERVGSARLIPLAGILAGFPRAARDLAREQGKEVDCLVRGGETGVDKSILLSLSDPMVHLLRNAVDHGLEEPAERERAGKSSKGRIVIAARAEADQLVIAMEDDGRGLDRDRLRTAAVARGILTEAQAAALPEGAVVDLVFLPGFTTREKAGELSGRGIGLDVVRRKVTELGGSVSVESWPGKGTRFTLRMPQSLSLMKVLLVRIDEDVYGVPAADVESVGRIDPSLVADVAGVKAVRHRDRLVPLVSLGALLALNGGPRARRPAAAFLAHGMDAAAVMVDGLCGEREVAVKSCGAFLKGMPFVSGAAALEDGRVALLLSTPDLIAAARRLEVLPLAVPDRKRLRILLVDDSAIARETEAALLRSLGHEVEEASDGEDGWRRLESGRYDLLLTDVLMPVLDGIDLARRVKASPRYRTLPVVILSSLNAPEERRRGLDAGADAYVVKGELEADHLAATLERLCGVPG